MTTVRPPPVAEGQIVAGKYRVERVLGTGGMGVVVAAHHLQLDQRVALKFLHREAMGSKESVNRFLREGQVLARLKSPNVARVMDVGTLEPQGEPYLVMEYLEGADLGVVLKDRGQLPVPEAVGYLLQACEAIAEAHAAGIVHRDLKPSNLFLTQGPDGLPLVKVLDFGISKATAMHQPKREADGTETATGSLVGSPLYMSPEQIRNPKKVDVRTDIWSLGVILYELLSGITPFEGETLSGALAAIVADAPTPIRTLRTDVPVELEEALKRCLMKDANDRYASIAELAHALGDFVTAESRGSVMRIARVLGVVIPQSAPTPQPPTLQGADEGKSATVPAWEGHPSPSPRKTRLALAVGVVVALGGVGFFAVMRSSTLDEQKTLGTSGHPSAAVPETPTTGSPALAAPVVTPIEPAATASAQAPPPSASAAPPPSASAAPPPKPQRAPAKPDPRKQKRHEETDDGTSDRK